MTYRLPNALLTDDDGPALDHLSTYYGLAGGGCYTGAFFDTWSGNHANQFTADDLVAVSFLSVFVPPLAARELLERQADRFTELLQAIGPDHDLAEDGGAIDPSWPAWRLYSELRRLAGVGPTIASKLCARKRPMLVPIYDSVVGRVTDAEKAQWVPLRDHLRAEGGRLQRRLLRLRDQVGLGEHVSALRVYDVISWMEGKSSGLEATLAEEQIGAAAAQGAG